MIYKHIKKQQQQSSKGTEFSLPDFNHQQNKMMMQSEILLQTSWPIQYHFHSNTDHYVDEHQEFHSSITSTPENSLISSGSYEYVEYPLLGYDHIQNPSLIDNDSQNINTLDEVCQWLCDDHQETEDIQLDSFIKDDVWSPGSMKSSVTIDDVMEIESQPGLQNLLKAYADAMAMEQTELAKVIARCIREKVNPIGSALERVAFNLFPESQGEQYLKEESKRNYKIAFRAFYDIFPYGRFAHFTANSTIMESVPSHVELVHIVDFDICEGSQWAVVIEAIAQQRKSLTITSVKLEEDESTFEQTKRQLSDYARYVGLNLKVQEMELEQLVKVMEGTKLHKEFFAFNCMVGLPHMVRTRKTTQVLDFLKVAKGVLANNKGIITLGNGEGERMENSSNYTSFFDGNLAYYKALYESMEWGFPSYLTEARIAMETLFVAPYVSSESWFQNWEEGREEMVYRKGFRLKECSMSIGSLNEARELVKEGESPYGIRIEGENGNEMALEWRGTPLVKVSAWV